MGGIQYSMHEKILAHIPGLRDLTINDAHHRSLLEIDEAINLVETS